MPHSTLAGLIFLATLLLTFGAALLARWHAKGDTEAGDLAGRSLNKWLVGLSAGTTGNSGFIVTGAVGAGYAGGLSTLLLPLGWLIGDIVFWTIFPARMNRFARGHGVTTIPGMLQAGISGRSRPAIAALSSTLILVCLGLYAIGQWLAGRKVLTGVFEISDWAAIGLFSALIISYSSIGGFRGSVYTDTLQAFIRILGTALALGAVTWLSSADPAGFHREIAAAGPGFLSLFGDAGLWASLGVLAGFAANSLGFGLGQPQLVARYLAGRSPEETQGAWWIYIGFIQVTWLAMGLFGVLLRGVMPGLGDPEAGLSVFFGRVMGPVATGLIVADIFATIASTTNGVLIAMAQTAQRDWRAGGGENVGTPTLTTIAIGAITVAGSLVIPGNVYWVTLTAVSMLAGGLGAPVMIKVLGWRHTGPSILAALVAGSLAALVWQRAGLAALFNPAGIGMLAGLAANAIVAWRDGAAALAQADRPERA